MCTLRHDAIPRVNHRFSYIHIFLYKGIMTELRLFSSLPAKWALTGGEMRRPKGLHSAGIWERGYSLIPTLPHTGNLLILTQLCPCCSFCPEQCLLFSCHLGCELIPQDLTQMLLTPPNIFQHLWALWKTRIKMSVSLENI